MGVGVIPEDEVETPFVSVFCLAGIVPSLSVIRRTVFDASPGWNEDFGQHYEDTLLFLRLALAAEVHYIARSLVRHRRHRGQSTGDAAKFAPQERKLYDCFRDLASLPPDQAAIVRDAWKFRERRLVPRRAITAAGGYARSGSPTKAARFLAGAARIALGSLVLGPGRVPS